MNIKNFYLNIQKGLIDFSCLLNCQKCSLNYLIRIDSVKMCSIIRLIFIAEASFFIYYLVTFSSYIYLLLVILLLSIIADGLSLLIENNGEEKLWYV